MSRKSWEPSAGRRRVSLNFSERILQTSYSIRRTRLSLRRTKNRAVNSRKPPARVSSRAKSPRRLQRRPSRSTRVPEHFSPPSDFLQPGEEAGELREDFHRKNGCGWSRLGYDYVDH